MSSCTKRATPAASTKATEAATELTASSADSVAGSLGTQRHGVRRVTVGWLDVTLVCDAPVLVPGALDPSAVRQIGVELRVFGETTSAMPAVVYLDAVSD